MYSLLLLLTKFYDDPKNSSFIAIWLCLSAVHFFKRIPVLPVLFWLKWRCSIPFKCKVVSFNLRHSLLVFDSSCSSGASTPYKRWSKCSMEKVREEGFCRFFQEIKGEAKISLLIVALISSANYHLIY